MAKTNKMSSISSERLKDAREYFGLNVYQVSQALKRITPEELLDYETGTAFPTYAKLELLADYYHRPLLYFFFKTPPKQSMLNVAFRRVENEIGGFLTMQTRLMMEKAEFYRLNISELYENQNPPIFYDMLEKGKKEPDFDFINWLRHQLQLPVETQVRFKGAADSFLEYIREKLYETGVYVFKDSFKNDHISGLCLYDKDYPVILLNNKTTFTRQVFTVFHEIYHLSQKESDVYLVQQKEEKACDTFANRFLIPEDDLNIQLEGVYDFENKALIQKLAKRYSVSPAAVANRLKTEGKITPGFYYTINEDGLRRMNSESSGGNYYSTQISYLGRPYLKRIFTDYFEGKTNLSTVGKYTGVKVIYLSQLSSYYIYGGKLE